MKKAIAVVGLLVLASAGGALATEEVKIPNDTGVPGIPFGNCDLTGYKNETVTFPDSIAVPDNDPAGIVLGPLTVPADGSNIVDVVIDLDMTHTWAGDIEVTVSYSGGGAPVALIDRPGVPESTFGCSGDLARGGYNFSDAGAPALGTVDCPSVIPSGCFVPETGSLSVFDGLPKGGDWYLTITDNAAGDRGYVFGWSVHILNDETTASETTSWGSLKGQYR